MMRTNLLLAYASPTNVPATEPRRIARLLSLKVGSDFDDVALAARMAKGLPAKSVASVAATLGLSGAAIRQVVPESTLRRYKKAKKPLSREHSASIYGMSLVADQLGRIFHGDAEMASAFMRRPHVLLGGETPFAMACSSSAGVRTVLKLLERAEAGVAL